jgi:hypothetical protein
MDQSGGFDCTEIQMGDPWEGRMDQSERGIFQGRGGKGAIRGMGGWTNQNAGIFVSSWRFSW